MIAALAATLALLLSSAQASYLVGSGRGDVTGPAADVNLMGYAMTNQTAAGIHTRTYARAYIVSDENTTICFVTVDMGMASQIVKSKVMAKLEAAGLSHMYNDATVTISGTHSHSTPAGMLSYVLYQITSLGYVKESTDAFVDGVYDAIMAAHSSLRPGSIRWAWGKVMNANMNRSPSSYLTNPAEERALYPDGNTDKNLTLLRFDDANGNPTAMVNWFAVHGTSLNNTNRLLSSDNKGYASYTFETKHNVTAAFASSNLGDVSPNINGTYCWNSGKPCNFDHSTCDGKNEYCVSRGPGKDMYESAKIIGERQMEVAEKLFMDDASLMEVSGPVSYIHTFVDMSNTTVVVNGTSHRTCLPAMGYAFAAGTVDGPGAFNFVQGDPGTGNPFWNAVRDLIKKPTAAEIACQAPKPILLPTGEIDVPYEWEPSIVPLSIYRIGQFFIISVPSEFTTMAGRRLRNAVRAKLIEGGAPDDSVVIIAGLADSYSSYTADFEEYQAQRYEAASTIFGPYQHAAYVSHYETLATALMTGNGPAYPKGPSPPDLSGKQLSFLPGVVVDGAPIGKKFGDVLDQPAASYTSGDIVTVKFQSANPRSNPRGYNTLTVQQKQADGSFVTVLTDAPATTRFYWKRVGVDQSEATIWFDSTDMKGTFRIQHFGYSKPLVGHVSPFSGTSNEFVVA